MPENCSRHKQPVIATITKNGVRKDLCQVCLYDPVKPHPNNRTKDDALLLKLGLIKK